MQPQPVAMAVQAITPDLDSVLDWWEEPVTPLMCKCLSRTRELVNRVKCDSLQVGEGGIQWKKIGSFRCRPIVCQ